MLWESRKLVLGFKSITAEISVPLNVTILEGTIIGIVGPNGSGKSTLLQTIAGIAEPLAGDISQEIDMSEISYLPQNPCDALLPWRKASKNLRLTRRDLAGDRAMLDEAHRFGLDLGCLSKPVYMLSGGQQQRLGWACALRPRTRLLLLDEPFSKQDMRSKLRLHGLLRRFISQTERAAVVVEHDPALLVRTVDVILSFQPTEDDLKFELCPPRRLTLSEDDRRNPSSSHAIEVTDDIIRKYFGFATVRDT